ncbi:MAG TPA: hypothetical protein PLN76_04255 [Saprospiraceae bacterium]|nr:hypothetical protein [Saprospiraceae bacterium]
MNFEIIKNNSDSISLLAPSYPNLKLVGNKDKSLFSGTENTSILIVTSEGENYDYNELLRYLYKNVEVNCIEKVTILDIPLTQSQYDKLKNGPLASIVISPVSVKLKIIDSDFIRFKNELFSKIWKFNIQNPICDRLIRLLKCPQSDVTQLSSFKNRMCSLKILSRILLKFKDGQQEFLNIR